MKLNSAVISLTDQEINGILRAMDLPVSEITVRSTGGRMKVRVRKGINFSFSIMFTADGRHLAATVDAGALGNALAGRVLEKIVNSTGKWGISRHERTLVFDPQKALETAGLQGDFRVEKTAVGAGELVFALEGDLPLGQFLRTSGG